MSIDRKCALSGSGRGPRGVFFVCGLATLPKNKIMPLLTQYGSARDVDLVWDVACAVPVDTAQIEQHGVYRLQLFIGQRTGRGTKEKSRVNNLVVNTVCNISAFYIVACA